MKMAIVFHCSLLLVTAITASAQTKGAITGRVVADDGSGVAGVTVVLFSTAASGGGERSTTTDEEGNFRFADLPARTYAVSVISSREYTQPPVTTAIGERRYYRIGENIQIALIRGGVITGRVTNAAGEPVIGMWVTAIPVRDAEGRPLQTSINSSQSSTDDRGVYRIYGLTPGGYILVANWNSNNYIGSAYFGEIPTFHPSSARDVASEVSVTSGSEATGIDIRYRGEIGHAVSGRMTETDQTVSVGPAVVYLTYAATGAFYNSTLINPGPGSGRFAFYGVPDGEYDVTAEGLADSRSDGLSSQTRPVTVRGADVTGVELKLSPKSSIAGKIVLETLPQRCEEKRQPALEEIVLQAHRDEAVKTPMVANLIFPRAATADEKGDFRLRALVPARYRIRASVPGESWYLKSMTASASPAARGAAPPSGADIARNGITLKPGERTSGVTVTIAEGAASLRGKVTPEKEGARLPAKLVVHLVPAEPASADNVLRYAEVAAERDGAFEFKNMAPGKYRISVRPSSDDEPIDRPIAPAAWDANERAKLRKEAEAMKIEIELKPCQRAADQVVKYR